MAQELGLLLAEPTFIRVQPNTCNLEPVKHLLQVNHVLLECLREHNDVVHVDQAQLLNKAGEHHVQVHHPLKGGWGVDKSKGHDKPLVLTSSCDKAGLGDN